MQSLKSRNKSGVTPKNSALKTVNVKSLKGKNGHGESDKRLKKYGVYPEIIRNKIEEMNQEGSSSVSFSSDKLDNEIVTSQTDLEKAESESSQTKDYLLLKLFETSEIDYFALVLVQKNSFFTRLCQLER